MIEFQTYSSYYKKRNYTVTIQATSDIYDDSTNSAPYTFTVSKLSAPTISKNTAGDGIEWPTYDTVTNKATSYVVEDKFTGEWIYLNTVSTLYYLLDTDATKMSPGVHEFRVKAIYTNQLTGEEVSKWSSDWSNSIQVTIQTLDSPVITFVIDSSGDQTSDVTWTAITGAEYYNIYVDDVKINTFTGTELEQSVTNKRKKSIIVNNKYLFALKTNLGAFLDEK